MKCSSRSRPSATGCGVLSTSTASCSTSWSSSDATSTPQRPSTCNRRGSEPRVVITYKLLSYPPALRRVLPNVDHRRQQRAEQPERRIHTSRRDNVNG